MSMSIHEKIRLLRETKCLTRAEFSKATDIQENTLKSIEQKGVIPKSDVLEKIATCWPEYAYWLLTGDIDPPRHISPNQQKEYDAIRMLEMSGYKVIGSDR